jgi:hypothetical protein
VGSENQGIYRPSKSDDRYALGFNSDRVYRWRLLLEEYGPEIVYIKGIHNTVADALLHLDFGTVPDDKENWMIFNKCLMLELLRLQKSSNVEESPSTTHEEKMNFVFANSSKDDAIYPLTVPEIANAIKRMTIHWANYIRKRIIPLN